jgi:hypothetical protein
MHWLAWYTHRVHKAETIEDAENHYRAFRIKRALRCWHRDVVNR